MANSFTTTTATAESAGSLTLLYANFLARVGKHLGYTRTVANWSVEQQARINEHIGDGLRRFYGEREWGFMQPWTQIQTVVNQADYTMDVGVGYLTSDLHYGGGTGYQPVVRIDVPQMMIFRTDTTTTGVPRFAALRPVATTGLISERAQLMLYPTPSEVWDLAFRVRLVPDMLSDDLRYALGAPLHSNTILEACLAAASLGDDDEIGIHEQAYQRELMRSVERDGLQYAPKTLGYNGNVRKTRNLLKPNLVITFD